ncbi:hypothetical protein R3P38DRAFT_3217394 [Favolaschia claudopus]|uniref:Uncharacterized protein n=1 Tax=Favolaschia claudopus TaxID=2862362 RepID=A0AAW0A4Y9_9AGAR
MLTSIALRLLGIMLPPPLARVLHTAHNFHSLNPPTQANHYQPSGRPAAQHRQFAIPEEQSTITLLLDTIQILHQDMFEIKDRLGSIETAILQRQSPTPPRGVATQRGGRIARSKGATPRIPQLRATAKTVPSRTTECEPATTADEDDGAPALDKVDVTDAERRALQTYVTQTFRRVCNVIGRHWPDTDVVRTNAVTQEVYLTPVFPKTVRDPRNAAFLHKVAQHAFAELEHPNNWPEGLDVERGPSFDLAYLLSLAKKSFNTLKRGWNEVQQVEAAINADANRRNHRQMMRRKHKAEYLLAVLQAFAAEHGLDPAVLVDAIHEQYLSDEVSGPDSDSGESKDAWKVRAAVEAGLPTTPDVLAKFEVFEILEPSWRSVWNYHLVRDARMGRESVMNSGMSGLYS